MRASGDGAIRVPEPEARRLWNWVLAEQGLADDTRLGSAEEIARRAVGLHAARLPSPFVTVAARAASSSIPLSLLAGLPRPGLRTVRCMRKTLHVLPPALAAVAAAATAHYRLRDVARLLRNAEVSVVTAERAVERITDYLGSSGAAGHRDIERHLVSGGLPVTAARLSLKLAWERGDVTYANDSTAWNREVRIFRPGPGTVPPRRDEAIRQVLEAYFRAYGPATVRDAAWWSGLPLMLVTAALATMDTVVLRLPWADRPFFMAADRYESFLAAEVPVGCVNLLAHEDVALKGYHESRSRYLGPVEHGHAFNAIGEALPSVLVDGQVQGRWAWDAATWSVRITPLPGGGRGLRSAGTRRRATAMSEVLTLGWSDRSPLG